MSFREKLKRLIYKKPADAADPRRSSEPIAGGRRKGEVENPYLAARRTWNDHVGQVMSQRNTCMIMGIMSLLIALAAIGGIVHIGSQSKFVPYIIEVDKTGQAVAIGPIRAGKADARVVHATIADWTSCARMVSADVALQRKCIFRVYSMLAPNDPATPKMNEWLNGTPDSSPFKRAERELVNIEIRSVIQQTPATWQVDWTESSRDRQGASRTPPATWRALVTTYVAEISPNITDDQLRNNPLSIYVRDFSWSKVQ